jgi:aminoglycoside/choline kinase family phosphotransferase
MEKIMGAGSSREFYRINIEGGKTAVLMRWDGKDGDWDYFLALNEIPQLRDIIPTIIEAKRDKNEVLVRDCGEFTLKKLFENAENREFLLDKVAEKLIFWQNAKIPETNIISKRIFTMPDLLWESDYFHEHISPLFPETKNMFLSADFERERNGIASLTDNLPKCLMHRDFQSENIVLSGDEVSFVDVQGARIGPCFYDVASLLFDPYLYPLITEELRKSFLRKLRIRDYDSLYLCAMQRLMQAMGAYGNLSSNKNKPQYRQFIKPAAIQALEICEKLGGYSVLREVLQRIVE